MAMSSIVCTAALSLLLGAGLGSAADSSCSNTLTTTYPAPVAAEGWQYRLVASGFTKPRSIAFDQDGGLLVLDSGVGLKHLTLKDEGGTCVSVADNKTLVADSKLNHGLALSGDGKTVYVSSSSSVFSFAYDSKAIAVDTSSNQTLVANMSNSDYTTRTLLMSSKKPGTLLVSRGSSTNEDSSASDLASGHSQIRSFDVSAAAANSSNHHGAYDFLDGHVIGWGLRNSVGVAEDPASGGIWSVENSVDELFRNGQDVHELNPAEELNYHGVLGSEESSSSAQPQGGNYGYPVCFAIWSTDGFPDPGSLGVGDQFPNDGAPANVTDAACNSDYVPPRLALQAHSAPLDIKFASDGSQAMVSFHGSWDSTTPVGYRIASLSFGADGQPTAPHSSADAVVDVLTNANITNCPNSCFRPVGLAWDAAGRLWFSSDSTGEIFVLEQANGTSPSSAAAGGLFPERSAALAFALAAVVAGLLLV